MKSLLVASLLALHCASAQAKDSDLPPSQAEVVAAERAFARVAGELGFQQSFIAFFADEGIGFGPHPFRMKETLISQPPSDAPMGLTWAPAFGDIAQAGDLGWNTGPTLFDATPDNKPRRHGMFFSVWKKQDDGSWRVVLDLGSETPAAVVPIDAPFQTSYRESGRPSAANVNVEKEIAALLVVEREFLAAANANVGQAYLGRLGDQARVHRPGAMPLVGREALQGWLGNQTMTLRGEPLKADVSISGDLGYAYGSYEIGGDEPQAGYYARVWKRDAKGQWRIVMDTISPLPAGVRPLTAESQQTE